MWHPLLKFFPGLEGSFRCDCNKDFIGDGQVCEDTINECDSYKCHSNATCLDEIGYFICGCNDGYNGDGFQCTDIDECTSGLHNCTLNAKCENLPGSFTCNCDQGGIDILFGIY